MDSHETDDKLRFIERTDPTNCERNTSESISLHQVSDKTT